jgi:hypothetical protein
VQAVVVERGGTVMRALDWLYAHFWTAVLLSALLGTALWVGAMLVIAALITLDIGCYAAGMDAAPDAGAERSEP